MRLWSVWATYKTVVYEARDVWLRFEEGKSGNSRIKKVGLQVVRT